jgi:hypothetical protein
MNYYMTGPTLNALHLEVPLDDRQVLSRSVPDRRRSVQSADEMSATSW